MLLAFWWIAGLPPPKMDTFSGSHSNVAQYVIWKDASFFPQLGIGSVYYT
jgi:hypothetical protein